MEGPSQSFPKVLYQVARANSHARKQGTTEGVEERLGRRDAQERDGLLLGDPDQIRRVANSHCGVLERSALQAVA